MMKKEYNSPKMVITSYEAQGSIMLVSGINQTTSNMTTKKYSEINF